MSASRVALTLVRRLGLGLSIIALASLALLLSDWKHYSPRAGMPRLAFIKYNSNPNLDLGVRGLEHFHLLCSVSGAKKEAFAVCDGNGLESLFRCTKQLFVGPGSVAAQDLFDLAPHRLDGIEVWRIRRQI
jgi:hypothetical protein